MSLIIKPKGKVYELFQQICGSHSLFISEVTLLELNKHRKKLLSYSKLSTTDFEILKTEILSHCTIVSSKFIPDDILVQAYHIVSKYHKNDLAFIATTIFIEALLWSGDKKLFIGLRRDGFMKIISTNELIAITGGL